MNYSNYNLSEFDDISDEELSKIFIENDDINLNMKYMNDTKIKSIVEIIKKKYYNKILKNINITSLLKVFHSKNIDFDFWENKYTLIDINKTISLLNLKNNLFLINDIKSNIFKKYIPKIKYFQLKLIYPLIKYDKEKYKILINGVSATYLNNLTSEFTEYDILFINSNYNYILRFNQISKFSTMSENEIDESYISNLQIILLLNTSEEFKIKKNIVAANISFLKLIINELNIDTFKYIITNLDSTTFYELINIIKTEYLIQILPDINNRILEYIILQLPVEKISRLIIHLSTTQFINILHLITNNKIECLKYISNEHKSYICDMFNEINSNLYQEYLPYLSKQIIYMLIHTEHKNIILDNIQFINIQNIQLFCNDLNYHSLIKILNKLSTNEIIYLTNHFNKQTIDRISNFIDMELCDSKDENSMIETIRLLDEYLNLNLSREALKILYNI